MVEVTRSGFTESIHHGTAVLINSNGDILKEWGNSNILIYPRSALKPIQSLNLYKDGVAEALNLSDKLIALTTASHHAETIHQEMVGNWLKKMHLNENHLNSFFKFFDSINVLCFLSFTNFSQRNFI